MSKILTIPQRVEALRNWMNMMGYKAFIIPTNDPHNSEYLPEYWKVRQWITGFTGSAGLAIVTLDDAALWTDSRYFLQAEEQLKGSPFTLMRSGEEDVPEPADWLYDKFKDEIDAYSELQHEIDLENDNGLSEDDDTEEFDEDDYDEEDDIEPFIGFYEETMSQKLMDDLADYIPLELFEGCANDPFETLWKDRPALSIGKVSIYPIEYAGNTPKEKINSLLKCIEETDCGAKGFFFTDLSEIAWILNVRGNDIKYNPVVTSYLYISHDVCTWYVDPRKLSPKVKKHLADNGVRVKHYNAWTDDIDTFGNILKCNNSLTSESANCKVMSYTDQFDAVVSPAEAIRSIKNDCEIAGFRKAMEADGVAMVRFLRWLDDSIGKTPLTEIDIDEQLTALRAEHPDFRSLSFATIAAYGPNGAIVHYEAEPDTAATLQPHGLLLLDSGAHYAYGTTDITRTIALGETTAEERKAYTLVLKGHIALSRMQFPEGATGLQLDTAARYAMWQHGYDFGHGTGHGVGACLPVHEGPLQIRKDNRLATRLPYLPGMVTSNEPGIYQAGQFGVRIENMMVVKENCKNAFGNFLGFETLTLCPYDLRPVDFDLLNQEEIAWINAYHDTVRDRLTPLLQDENDRRWLEEATKPVIF